MKFCDKVAEGFLAEDFLLKSRKKREKVLQKIKFRNPLSWCIKLNMLNTLRNITKKKRKTKSKRKPTNKKF